MSITFLAPLRAWVKSLPPQVQSLYYSFEFAVIIAIIAFCTALSAYLQSHNSFAGFDWSGQLKVLYMALAGAALKLLIDLLKGFAPALTAGKGS